MAKKKVHKKTASKYQHFKLHGNHKTEKLIFFIALDLVISFALGLVIQGQIASVLASY